MPFVYDLELAHNEPDRMFVQQLVPVGRMVPWTGTAPRRARAC